MYELKYFSTFTIFIIYHIGMNSRWYQIYVLKRWFLGLCNVNHEIPRKDNIMFIYELILYLIIS